MQYVGPCILDSYHHLWFHIPHFENQVYFHLHVEKDKDYNSFSSFEGATVIYRVSREECARLREGVPYVKVY